jgi:hypothetical protein
VEQAVLRAFRDAEFRPQPTVEPERAAPAAWKLSRIFEYGAYAAVAAALIMAAFLGSRLLHDRQAQQQPQALSKVAPPQSGITRTTGAAAKVVTAADVTKTAKVTTSDGRIRSSSRVSGRVSATASDTDDYVALMLCDPLICSGDEQVVRMELPATAVSGDSSTGQPVLADVVIGEDGLVRAMRIVR